MKEDSTVCIVDFNGTVVSTGPTGIETRLPGAWWADYDPTENAVIFGGDWGEVPPLKVSEEPTQLRVEAHAKQFLTTNN